MRIDIPGYEGQNLEIAEDASEETVAEAFASSQAGMETASKIGKAAWFETWPLEMDMDASTAAQIAEKYLEGGPEAVYDFAVSNDWDRSPEETFREHVSDDLRRAVAPFVEAVTEKSDRIDADELADALCEAMKDDVIEAMTEKDESSFETSIPGHVTVEAAFIPDYHEYGVDDMFMHHWDVVFSPETAIADSNLMRFLKFMNVSPSEFVAACRERGFDPANPERGENVSDYRWRQAEENALAWRAILSVETGNGEEAGKLPLTSKYEIAEWNRTVDIVRTGKDADRPPLMSMDDLFTTMENASYGGVAVWAAKLPLRELLEGKFSKPFKATGGLTGIHDFINGSGYIERMEGTVFIDPSRGGLRVSAGTGRWSIDDVYGFVGSVWKTETDAWEKPEWTRSSKTSWFREGPDGCVSVIRSVSPTSFEAVTEGPGGEATSTHADLETAKEAAERDMEELRKADTPAPPAP